MFAGNIYSHLGVLKSPRARPLLAAGYTVILTVTLLQSSGHPLIGAPAPPGPPDAVREMLLTLGHIVGFSLFTALLWWALLPTLPPRRALVVAVSFVLVYGAITELAQMLVPDRSASWDDLATDWIVTLVAAWAIRRFSHAPG
jgi:VanZ family protein